MYYDEEKAFRLRQKEKQRRKERKERIKWGVIGIIIYTIIILTVFAWLCGAENLKQVIDFYIYLLK